MPVQLGQRLVFDRPGFLTHQIRAGHVGPGVAILGPQRVAEPREDELQIGVSQSLVGGGETRTRGSLLDKIESASLRTSAGVRPLRIDSANDCI